MRNICTRKWDTRTASILHRKSFLEANLKSITHPMMLTACPVGHETRKYFVPFDIVEVSSNAVVMFENSSPQSLSLVCTSQIPNNQHDGILSSIWNSQGGMLTTVVEWQWKRPDPSNDEYCNDSQGWKNTKQNMWKTIQLTKWIQYEQISRRADKLQCKNSCRTMRQRKNIKRQYTTSLWETHTEMALKAWKASEHSGEKYSRYIEE